MRIIKLFEKNTPKFFVLVKRRDNRILVNYPISKPDRFRVARWIDLDRVRIDWVREFSETPENL